MRLTNRFYENKKHIENRVDHTASMITECT